MQTALYAFAPLPRGAGRFSVAFGCALAVFAALMVRYCCTCVLRSRY